jgi:hypothetical protein
MSHCTTTDQPVNTFQLLRLFDTLSSENKQINKFYIKITGSITGGYFLTQLVYLFKAFKYQPFFKQDSKMISMYLFTKKELRNHRQKLIDLDLISTERRGSPAKLFYTVNIQKIIDLAVSDSLINPPSDEDQQPELENAQLCPKGTSSYAQKAQHIITTNKELLINKKEIYKERMNFTLPAALVCSEFDKWWEQYPVKKSKQKAQEAFSKALKGGTSFDFIFMALLAQMTEKRLLEASGAFSPAWPHPTSWLNQKRWEDSVQTEEQIKTQALKGQGGTFQDRRAAVNVEGFQSAGRAFDRLVNSDGDF